MRWQGTGRGYHGGKSDGLTASLLPCIVLPKKTLSVCITPCIQPSQSRDDKRAKHLCMLRAIAPFLPWRLHGGRGDRPAESGNKLEQTAGTVARFGRKSKHPATVLAAQQDKSDAQPLDMLTKPGGANSRKDNFYNGLTANLPGFCHALKDPCAQHLGGFKWPGGISGPVKEPIRCPQRYPKSSWASFRAFKTLEVIGASARI